MESLPKISRRLFLKTAALTAGALSVAKELGSQAWAAATVSDAKILEKSAQKQAYKRISLTSLPTESQYQTHKTNLDKAITELKIDNKAGKIIPQCANCLQYKPKNPGDEYGACAMVQANLGGANPSAVHKTGWCKIYAVKKDKTTIEKSAN